MQRGSLSKRADDQCRMFSEWQVFNFSSHIFNTSESAASPNTSTSVVENFRALIPRSNKRSSSAKERPWGSGTRKYVQIMQQKQIPPFIFGPSLNGFGNGEERTNPEETGVIAPIPRTGVQHVGRENAADYTDDVARRESAMHVTKGLLRVLKISS